MGKPYAKELLTIPETAAWAATIDVSPLEQFVADTFNQSLIAIGSGGSSTAAHLAALLHRARHRMTARHATPLDVVLSEGGLGNAAALVLSASGRNRDVLMALDACISAEVSAIATVTTRTESPLAKRARSYMRSYIMDASLPAGKDGYLATNSLVATVIFLLRGYGYDDVQSTPVEHFDHEPLRSRPMVVILHGGWGAPVATDLESKLNESALGAALISDYRNFGHGRHLWLAKRTDETVVIALITPDVEALAKRTLAQFPRNIPVVRVSTSVHGPRGTLDLLVRGFSLVAAFGLAADEDPGRPHVPEFGRKLYSLDPRLGWTATTPIERKLRSAPVRSDDIGQLYRAGLAPFIQRLASARIGGIVFDFDGTLCTREERRGALRCDLALACVALLNNNILVGIATGRGPSVREQLQKSLPAHLWPKVTIGYYNGSEISTLNDENVPDRQVSPVSSLAEALKLLEADPILSSRVKFTARMRQIAIEPLVRLDPIALVSHVATIVSRVKDASLHVVASSHSVDVLADCVSKRNVVLRIQEQLESDCVVLTIGDSGAWPGNDYALLDGSLALSVDKVSSLVEACWNLAPAGVCGPDAVLFYLRRLQYIDGAAQFCAEGIPS